MKKLGFCLFALVAVLCLGALVGCDLSAILGGGDSDTVHTSSYEPITGKFLLYEAADERVDPAGTYFEIDGSSGNFSLKYYENGALKVEGVFQRVVTRPDGVGYMTDNLHFNLKCEDGARYLHVGAYAETFDPVDQFRILEEYTGGKTEEKFFYSELPFVLGTYLREGAEYKPEAADRNTPAHATPTLEQFTAALDGKYALDGEHYFYFISPRGYTGKNGFYLDSYFQYFAPGLEAPLEGFVRGLTAKDSLAPPRLTFTYSKESLYYKSHADTEKTLMFGYSTFEEDGDMREHYGAIDFGGGVLHSFSFEHLSRSYTEAEWDKFTSDESYRMPDAILYEYAGGEYVLAPASTQ